MLSVLMDISLGMNYLHSLTLIHRDMNLGNFLLTSDFVVKVCDFGTTKIIDVNQNIDELTADVGARMFSAPESHTCNYTSKCDNWSFGVVLFLLFKPGRKYPSVNMMGYDRAKWFEEISPSDAVEIKALCGYLNFSYLMFHAEIRAEALQYVEGPLRGLVEKCLRVIAKNRPTFPEIMQELVRIEELTGIQRQRSPEMLW